MAIKSSRKRNGYAAWLLTKVFDELTGNYYRDSVTESQVKPLMSKSARISEENASCVDELDRFDDVSFK